ncbi:hypothetical protein G6F59_014330 [Rhizopus arrhizus]|nr:hypothetical protein G6F59_014330 [Rhizopus arrhizus]
MAPPQLTRDAPVLDVVQPLVVDGGPVVRIELDAAVGHHVQRRHARDDPQELADVADDVAAQRQDALLGRAHQLHPFAVGPHADAALGGQIVAVQAAQQGAFPGARRAGQHQAIAGGRVEIHSIQHGQADAALVVQGEHLSEAPHLDHGSGFAHVQLCRMEDTSNWV